MSDSESDHDLPLDKTNPMDDVSSKDTSKKPVAVIVIGMAGSGKTTLMQCIGQHFESLSDEERDSAYFINLDPAVNNSEGLPYFANIDIRDTIKYKEVMKQYGLGPNGGIVTSLNLFATRFDQVLTYCEKKSEENSLEYIFLDTPGQIEVFTWSASGAIITETLAATFPTTILYVVDTPRNLSPATFMSNMMYACSIMFKTKLPFLLVFNKIDVADHQFLVEWMDDIDKFFDALKTHSETTSSDSYMSSLSRSMALVLDEFYRAIKSVGVSAATGEGLDELFSAIASTREDYETMYLPLMERRRKAREDLQMKLNEEKLEQLKLDSEAEKTKAIQNGKYPVEEDDDEE